MRAPLPTHLLLLLAVGVCPAVAAALVVASGDPATEQAPEPDFGWAHVGRLGGEGGVSAVYLGEGWVLTAGHAGIGKLELGEAIHRPVPASRVVLLAPGGSGARSDLALFRIESAPPLPRLELTERTPGRGTRILLVGFGFGRGEPLEARGFRWAPPRGKRWGTNRVSGQPVDVAGPGNTITRCFRTDFSRHGTPQEAHATPGDSGGGVFTKTADGWRLAGIMVAVSRDEGQPGGTSLFGNTLSIADLSAYAVQIQRLRGTGGPK
ncbi:MAG: hypothetical protein QNK04_08060 [Myxococcota bacterium]|nr:hypothetical protein [Myxococcota bacterium]